MNHRYRPAPRPQLRHSRSIVLAAVLAAGSLAALPSGALAQAAAAPPPRSLPASIKTSADVKPVIPQITAFVNGHVATIASDKATPKAQQDARDALIRESGGGAAGVNAPSPSFLDAYASAVNTAMAPLGKSTSIRTRLLAAVTLTKVANNTKNGKVGDAVAPFALDESVAVALWGMRAAAPTIAPLAKAGTPTKLPAAVVEGVKKHPTSGDLIDEAYKALTLGNQVNAASAAVVAPDVLKLFQYRVGLYVTTTPPRTETDRAAVNFLSLEGLWATPTGKQLQPQIMQEFVNFAGLAAQHTAARDGAERRQFIDKLKGLGSALTQIGGPTRLNDPGIVAAGQKLGTVSPDMPADKVTDLATAVMTAAKAKFPTIKPFPTMDPGATAEPKEEEIVESVGGDDVTLGGPATQRATTQPSAGAAIAAPATTAPKQPAPTPPGGTAPKQPAPGGTPPAPGGATPAPGTAPGTPKLPGAK